MERWSPFIYPPVHQNSQRPFRFIVRLPPRGHRGWHELRQPVRSEVQAPTPRGQPWALPGATSVGEEVIAAADGSSQRMIGGNAAIKGEQTSNTSSRTADNIKSLIFFNEGENALDQGVGLGQQIGWAPQPTEMHQGVSYSSPSVKAANGRDR